MTDQSKQSSGSNTLKVSESSDEFSQVYHYLSMCIDKYGSVSGLEVWKVVNPETASMFDKKAGGMLRLPCWVDTSTLPEGDDVESVCRHGFRFGKTSGMSFRSGNASFPEDCISGQSFQAMYCEVAVGRAYINDGAVSAKKLPTGFNSFYMSNEKLDRNDDGHFSIAEYQSAVNFDYRDPKEYSHEYFISDPSQVCPKYIVHFVLNHHNPAAQSKLGSASNSSLSNEENYEYFDPVQYRAVSSKEKLSNAQLSRRLITIQQAYQFAQDEARKEDPVLQSKIDWIDSQLTEIDDVLRAVNLNYAEMHDVIVSASESALRRLEMLTREKLELLLSVELELRREKEEILWVEEFVAQKLKAPKNKQLSQAELLSFLQAWKNHAILRNGLSRLKPKETETLATVKPDLNVVANIAVTTGERNKHVERGEEQDETSGTPQRESATPTSNNGQQSFQLYQFLSGVKESGLYGGTPARPSEILISPGTQALVDVNMSKIEHALSEALDEVGSGKRAIPLPQSVTWSAVSGAPYPLPGPAATAPSGYTSRELGEDQIQRQLEGHMKNVIGQGTSEHRGIGRQTSVGQPRVQSSTSPITKQLSAPVLRTQRTHEISPARNTEFIGVSIPEEDTCDTNDFSANEGDVTAHLMSATAQYRPAFSIQEGAAKRRKQLSSTNFNLTEKHVFHGSSVLTPQEAQHLYFNMPFFARPPECKLIYSTRKNNRGIAHLLKAAEMVSGHFKFGAYLNQSITATGSWSGSPACFIYSVTLDLKFPYHGRCPPGRGQSDFPCAFFVDYDHIEIGNGDLHIDESFITGYSELEGCYGLGLPRGSAEASAILAGSGSFEIDDLELWYIASTSTA